MKPSRGIRLFEIRRICNTEIDAPPVMAHLPRQVARLKQFHHPWVEIETNPFASRRLSAEDMSELNSKSSESSTRALPF